MNKIKYVIAQNDEQLKQMIHYLDKQNYHFNFDTDTVNTDKDDQILVLDFDRKSVDIETAERVLEDAEKAVISTERYFEFITEPTVTILWSEHSRFHDGETMSLSKANTIFGGLDLMAKSDPGYYKTEFRIDFVMNGRSENYKGRQDLGDGDGTLINHIQNFHTYYLNNVDRGISILQHKGTEAVKEDKMQHERLLKEFIPYLKLHCDLSERERTAMDALQSKNDLTPSETSYCNAVLAYVSESRMLVNQGEYNLPPIPQLEDFNAELQAEDHIREGTILEKADARLSLDESPDATKTTQQVESTNIYYPIDEAAARRAQEAISFSNYKSGSATAEYRKMVDKAVEIAEHQKKRVDTMYRDKIDKLVDTYARKLAENINKKNEITASVPSVMITGSGHFPTNQKARQNAAISKNMQELTKIEDLLRKIRSTGMGGISADDPNAIYKLESKLAKLKQAQEIMKAVNIYYRKNKTLDGCSCLSSKQIEALKKSMSESWSPNPKPFESYALSNNNAEIHRIEGRIAELKKRNESAFVGWKFDGGEVKTNAEANRLQIFFEEKPSSDVRAELKSHGFRYAPSIGAWQRQLTNNAINATNSIKSIQPLTGEHRTELQKRTEQVNQTTQISPDTLKTGEQIRTPRGSFSVTAMTREQIEAAGYGYHHTSADGKYLIMGNGTRAFAVAASVKDNTKESEAPTGFKSLDQRIKAAQDRKDQFSKDEQQKQIGAADIER